MRKISTVYVALVVLLFGSTPLRLAGQSGSQFRRTAVHNGNQVRSVFGNWGVIGQPATNGPRGAWKNDNNGYLGDVSPFVGADVKWLDTTFRSVVTCPMSRPALNQDINPLTGKPWTFEPVEGYLNANQDKIAMSTNRNSWPPFWPDKLNDLTDPGWKGSWNGYFGKRASADQESYFAMDDNNDERFNIATNNPRSIAFHADSTDLNRKGLGLSVSVRGLQWSQFLAKDNIFWLYEINNTSTTNYNRVVFGMLVGTYVGVTGTDDSPQEYDDDWSFYDVATNITYTGDFGRSMSRNKRWVGPVGMVGYAFLESPGSPFDGIDNDGDADSSSVGVAAPKFISTDFDSTPIPVGSRLVLIDTNFARTIFTVPAVESVFVHTRGSYRWIYPGKTKAAEGNLLRDFQGNEFVNRNSYDGVDNDYDGLIDENYYIHYRQIKRTRTTPPKTLIDILRPVRHINYLTGVGNDPLSMIDERRNDLIDNDRDWIDEFDDVGRDGIAGTGDFGENDRAPTSGYDNAGNDTQLPGEPDIDKTDVTESDQIGLTSFYYFTNQSAPVQLGNDEVLWNNLAPGFFDVPASIVNNKPEAGEDGDFIYGSGYFPLLAKSTERFSLALVYGGGNGGTVDDDVADLLKNKKTVQKIYDANYQFPQPPDKPTLVAVTGDKQVTLYWDRKSEQSIDPVLRTKDFEGYKLYRSTDPDFSDLFTITDANGTPQGYRPLVQYDIQDGLTGYFRPDDELFEAASGYSFYLGSDNGLQHSYVDRGVENGRRYFYALVAYDMGSETIGIFPGENTKFVSILPSGEIVHDINVAVVVPNAKSAGYVAPSTGVPLQHVQTYGSGSAAYTVVDETKTTGHTYQVEFLDTQVDSIDNNGNGRMDAADSTEWTRITTSYTVKDLQLLSEPFISQDTSVVVLMRAHLVPPTIAVKDQNGVPITPTNYIVDAEHGTIKGSTPGSLPPGSYSITYLYYPVYKSPYIQGSPYTVETKDGDIFDGVGVQFNNQWDTRLVDSLSGWIGKNAYVFNMSTFDVDPYRGYRRPADYEFQFSNVIVDTSQESIDLGVSAVPVNFRIYNATEGVYVKFWFAEQTPSGAGKLSPLDEIVFLENNPTGQFSPTWDVFFINKPNEPVDTVYDLTTGDKLVLKSTKPFRQGDMFEFTTTLPRVDQALAGEQLTRVRAVPNPYVTASPFELPLNPGITSGRGERKIDFVHLPANSTIQIFTSRGDHVVSLRHDGSIEDGTLSWNLKTKENLDIAYGVYFYVVESPVGTKTGKLAIIK